MAEIVKYQITITKQDKEEVRLHIADLPTIEKIVEQYYNDGADAVELELLEKHFVRQYK